MIGKKPNPPIQVNMDDIVIAKNEIRPEEALKNQLMNMFQQNPNHFNPQQWTTILIIFLSYFFNLVKTWNIWINDKMKVKNANFSVLLPCSFWKNNNFFYCVKSKLF